jgi:hypothetical protein
MRGRAAPSRNAAWGCKRFRLHACFRLFPDAGSVAVGVKSPEAASAPSRGEVPGIVACVVTAQPFGELEERPEQGRAVIVRQLDQAGFLDQAAELNEMAGALAACLGPIAHVGASLLRVESVTLQPETRHAQARRSRRSDQGTPG